MNLGKLLSSGKTIFGGKDTLCYRRNKLVYLPKFNADKYALSSKPAEPVTVAPQKMGKVAAPVAAQTQKIPAAAVAARPAHVTSWKTRLNPFRAPAPVAPSAVDVTQPELSLAAVKPVANDLSDADIEIVPVRSHTMAPVAPADASPAPMLPPARQAWEFLGEWLVKPV
jgi:hypothetical protein